jgi:hypothetical protein
MGQPLALTTLIVFAPVLASLPPGVRPSSASARRIAADLRAAIRTSALKAGDTVPRAGAPPAVP